MSLLVIISAIIIATIASAATFTTYFLYPQYFVVSALITAGSVLFGVLFVIAEYFITLLAESYLR